MTEISGDMTVPDGKITWGDGMGGIKEGESEVGSLAGVDLDLVEEDSPYPEVRASVSNLDDPDMPGESSMPILFCVNRCSSHVSRVAPWLILFHHCRLDQYLLLLSHTGTVYFPVDRPVCYAHPTHQSADHRPAGSWSIRAENFLRISSQFEIFVLRDGLADLSSA